MKFSIKFSWPLLINIINAVLIIALIASFWLNYSWIQTVQISTETKTAAIPPSIDNKTYEKVLEKIDAKQKIPTPDVGGVRDIMAQPISTNANTNTPLTNTNSGR